MELNSREIMEILPHRYPFLLVDRENKGKLVFFGGVKSARFRKQVVPGDVLELHCEIIKRRGSVGIGSAKALVDGVVAAEAELTFAIEK